MKNHQEHVRFLVLLKVVSLHDYQYKKGHYDLVMDYYRIDKVTLNGWYVDEYHSKVEKSNIMIFHFIPKIEFNC